jgi:putative colanic acid biosynthesis acetyltransferase WcaF
MEVRLSTFNNSSYRPGSFIKRFTWHYVNWVILQSGLLPFFGIKVFFLRLYGAKVGKGLVIKPFVNIKYPWFLTIGDHCWIGEGVWIDNLAPVILGSNVCLSQGSYLLTGNHDFTKSTFDLITKPINIESGAWIGAKSVVGPGVICGSHSILTAGSVITQDMEPYGIYQGNKAVKVKTRVIKG